MRAIFTLIFIFTCFFNMALKANEGSVLYHKKDFDKALSYYQNIYKNDPSNFAVLYNLGHVYFRLNDFVKSMYFFHAAMAENPRFSDAEYNYQYVHKKMLSPEKFETPWIDKIPLSLREWVGLGIILTLLLWPVVLIPLLKKKFDKLIPIILVLLLLTLGLGSYKYYVRGIIGVVSIDKSSVFSNPGVDNVVLFSVPLGVQVLILENYVDGEWKKVSLPNGKKGWIETRNLFLGLQF